MRGEGAAVRLAGEIVEVARAQQVSWRHLLHIWWAIRPYKAQLEKGPSNISFRYRSVFILSS